jgi:DNA-binding transcriptional LysR family regulator
VTQQTLSSTVKQLEERFGVLLVQRGSRFQGFTPEGEKLLQWARRIVGDYRAMHQDIASLRRGLSGSLRIAAVPTALPMVARLTTPFRARHPGVHFRILSATSDEILQMLGELEIDAGLSYLGNEPIPSRVSISPLYLERYRLVTAQDSLHGDRQTVTWAEVAQVPLCLLTPETQNRRIIDAQLRAAGRPPAPTLESNSMTVLMTHVRTARWASVMPAVLADEFGPVEGVRSIAIVAPDIAHTIGLVVPQRQPMTPMVSALVFEAKRLAADLQAQAAGGSSDNKALSLHGNA